MHQLSLSRGILLGMFPRLYEPSGYCSKKWQVLSIPHSILQDGEEIQGGRAGVQEGEWLRPPLDCSSELLLASMQGYRGVVVPQDMIFCTNV